MAKPRYIKGKDGKMQGSIGSGKTDVPTSTPKVPVTGAVPNTEPAAGYASAYERFQASKPSTRPVTTLSIPAGMTGNIDNPDNGYLNSGTYSGFYDLDDDPEDPTKPFEAWIETHLEFDDEEEIVATHKFATGEEAREWVVAETGARYQELEDFKNRLSALDGDTFSYSLDMIEEAKEQGINVSALEGYDTENAGFTDQAISMGNRSASILTGFFGTSFVDTSVDGETRHYVEFEDRTEAEAFALRMTVFGK